MIIGTLELNLRFPEPQSLKEKRMILKSLVTRMKNQFNIAIAEVEGMDLWQSSTLAVAAIGRETKQVNEVLDRVINFINAVHGVELTNHSLTIL